VEALRIIDVLDEPGEVRLGLRLAFQFAIERLLPMLEIQKQTDVIIMAEARGQKENKDLERGFLRFINAGNRYISVARLKRIQLSLRFYRKKANMVKMQIADLAAYPTARYALDPSRANPPFDAIRPKFLRQGRVNGLKMLP